MATFIVNENVNVVMPAGDGRWMWIRLEQPCSEHPKPVDVAAISLYATQQEAVNRAMETEADQWINAETPVYADHSDEEWAR